MLATISGMPVHSRPECLNLNVRCSSTCRCMHMRDGACPCLVVVGVLHVTAGCVQRPVGCGAVGTRSSGCGAVECALVACGLAVGGLVRVGGAQQERQQGHTRRRSREDLIQSSRVRGPGGWLLNQSMRP